MNASCWIEFRFIVHVSFALFRLLCFGFIRFIRSNMQPMSTLPRFLSTVPKGRLGKAKEVAIQPSYYYESEHEKLVVHCGAESQTVGVSLEITFH
jgi:hypothetical protein